MQSALTIDTENETLTARVYKAPPNWDALFAKSRGILLPLCDSVVSEATKGHAVNGFTKDEVATLNRSLRILVQAYAVGILSSAEVESSALAKPSSFSVTFSVVPSAAELRSFRRRHSSLVAHCLARLYWLAWAAQDRPFWSLSETIREDVEWENDRWPFALKAAHDRLEWACFTDLMDRE